MTYKELFQAQLERETVATRKAIERVPEGRGDWQPHPKSMPLGRLASLVATMLGWVAFVIEQDQLDFDQPSSEQFKNKDGESKEEMLRKLDENVAKSRAALATVSEEHLQKPWKFIAGGHVITDDPRHIVLTDSVFSHLAHHRGQLTVYLRMNDASVPAIYGPSADEQH